MSRAVIQDYTSAWASTVQDAHIEQVESPPGKQYAELAGTEKARTVYFATLTTLKGQTESLSFTTLPAAQLWLLDQLAYFSHGGY